MHPTPTTSSPETSVSHGIELLGDDELRERERHEAEAEDADRVRHGDGRAEDELRDAGVPVVPTR